MAYYPPEFRRAHPPDQAPAGAALLPLKVIKDLLEAQGDRLRISRAEVARRYDLPRKMLDRLADLGVLTPNDGGYDPTTSRSSSDGRVSRRRL